MRTLARILLVLGLSTCAIASLGAPQAGLLQRKIKERLEQQPAPTSNADVKDRIAKAGDYIYKIQHDGSTRFYQVHVPVGFDPSRSVPLLFALHGGGGSMEFQANDDNYGLIDKSNRAGFVAVFPNGFSHFASGKFATWNAGNCCASARDEDIDDVGFIRQILSNLEQQLNVDRERIYATGMSNGGMMAYRLACEMSDVFKAIASVAGTDNTKQCAPVKPISILHIHAKNDPRVHFDGGAGFDSRAQSLVTDFTSVGATVSKWAKLDGCAATPKRILDKPDGYCEVYASCKNNVHVEVCVTATGGHSWPGVHKTRGEPASQAISANDVMWEFFTAAH